LHYFDGSIGTPACAACCQRARAEEGIGVLSTQEIPEIILSKSVGRGNYHVYFASRSAAGLLKAKYVLKGAIHHWDQPRKEPLYHLKLFPKVYQRTSRSEIISSPPITARPAPKLASQPPDLSPAQPSDSPPQTHSAQPAPSPPQKH
jgi:hypothetical protein